MMIFSVISKSVKASLASTKVRAALIVLYVLMVLGFSANVQAEEVIFPIQKPSVTAGATKSLVGEVVVDNQNTAYLVISDRQYYEIKMARKDLTAFNGQVVEVEGFELSYKSGPVYQTANFHMVFDGPEVESSGAPIFVVLRINEVSF